MRCPALWGCFQSVAFRRCDVSNREEVFKVAEKVREEVGHVTILINNAGIMPCRTIMNYTPEEIKRIFDINVLAHFWVSFFEKIAVPIEIPFVLLLLFGCLRLISLQTTQAFLPSMIQRNHGHIVALSSMAGFIGLANLVPYCASKFAVRGKRRVSFTSLSLPRRLFLCNYMHKGFVL